MRIEAANLAGSLWICSVVNHGVQGVGVPSWVPDPELEGAVPKSSALSWTCWLLLEPRLIGALARLLVSSSIWPLSSESDFFFTATCNALTLVSPDEPHVGWIGQIQMWLKNQWPQRPGVFHCSSRCPPRRSSPSSQTLPRWWKYFDHSRFAAVVSPTPFATAHSTPRCAARVKRQTGRDWRGLAPPRRGPCFWPRFTVGVQPHSNQSRQRG
ncbi:hypothetical protein MPN_371 [Mycoplasmoides pneumoniae M129]|uniref:Uncharacterized protein MPN_371 n=1 Tax=Mycoplasma pneumoniae (strain ATCC 29342 / M129 / Subtype 1) TaxID=272634 RepID=Y371_MYCPN|nr:RecName: Full=Uncharacterized protein MPN_371 [Mycoplasmoides pneumoniae M129]AAB96113.1 hypothetical protein MPN_371 [Mycoplasmoides pneumoniae M129]CAG7571429.1 Uncharacterized protein MPN_371 [Mycoplasmoides pneumoniae M129]